jgi:hypothetical protein
MAGTSHTKPTYDEPSQLSRWLVAGLSVAVLMMAGWFVVTVSRSATTAAKGNASNAANADTAATLAAGTAASGTEDVPNQRSTSVHFDWPAFASQPAPSSPRMTLSLPPEPADGGDITHAPWLPATPVPDYRDRTASSPAASEQAGAVGGNLTSPPSRAAAGREVATAMPPRQASRKQKTRVDSDAGQ